MTSQELRQKYFDFFVEKGHKVIPSASLIPENDPTTLFISAGMHPLVPYLLGESHPEGKRLVGLQKCLRTGDIDEVGDRTHHTFFEMLGNWSLGDYWKKEAIEWSFEFLTGKDWLGIDKEKLAVSVFAGDNDAPFDQESYDLWLGLGIPKERIAKLPKENNWWGPAGETGPCGPDTEMFVWAGKGEAPLSFDPDNADWVEAWNDVFMEYEKTKEGSFIPLKQKNVDTGMGLERILAVLGKCDDDYQTELFWPIIEKLEKISGKKYDEQKRDFRVAADHLRASVFILNEGVSPSNTGQGYILRRLIRRAIRKGFKFLKINHPFTKEVAEIIIELYKKECPELEKKRSFIVSSLEEEEEKFQVSLDWLEQYRQDLLEAKERKILKKIKNIPILSGPETASGFYVYENFQTYGVPPDLSQEIVAEVGLKFNQKEFDDAFKKHQELSRTASSGMFKGGLADQSEIATKYHTTTHLLQAALRKVLGEHVFQKGSNITSERLRFDFSHTAKLTEDELKNTEDLVNEKIEENLPVKMEIMTLKKAKEKGALAVFEGKYGEKVKVYSVDSFSVEVCGGPHVDWTGQLGKFKIIKEEAASSGVRRIYATLWNCPMF